NCTERPLMLPVVSKCPPRPAVSTMREPALPPLASPTRPGAAPMRSSITLPPTSTCAWPSSSLSSFTPFTVLPTATARGLPSMMSRARSLPLLPLSDTVCADAALQARHSANTSLIGSFPEIGEAQRQVGDLALEQRNRHLQIVSLGAADAHHIALDRCLHLHLALLDEPLDLLRRVAVDAGLDDDTLLELVAADLLRLGAAVEESCIDLALGQLGQQDIHHLAELEVAVGVEREFLVAELDARVAALEVEARADLLVGLVDGVAHFDEVGFDDSVEARHGVGKKMKGWDRRKFCHANDPADRARHQP